MSDKLQKEIQEKFGKRIQQIRTERKFSKTYLADILDMERVSLTNIEKGKRNVTLKTLTALANALGVTMSFLLDFEAPLTGITNPKKKTIPIKKKKAVKRKM